MQPTASDRANESEEVSIFAKEAECSADSACDDFGDWEVVDETIIAVDHSNVQVFSKTLKDFKHKGVNAASNLKVNIEEGLCDKVFISDEQTITQDQISEQLYRSGFISLDLVN